MSEAESSIYWDLIEQRKTPLETLISDSRSQATMRRFAAGTEAVFAYTREVNPDIIFYPERGATPFTWAQEEWEGHWGVSYPKIPLEIGSWTDVAHAANTHGIKLEQKRDIIRRALHLMHSNGRFGVPQKITNPMLIDEVQTGSTLSVATKELIAGLTEIYGCKRLHIVAAQDSRINGLNRDKVPYYQQMASNMIDGFQVAVIPMPLILMDRSTLLNTLFMPVGAPKNERHLMQHTLHNQEARELVKQLVDGYIFPDKLLHTVRAVRLGEGANLANQRMHQWVSQVVHDTNRYTPDEILTWLKHYAMQILEQKKVVEAV